MNRLLGIVVMVGLIYGVLMLSEPSARTAYNHAQLGHRLGTYGVITVGVGILIVAGGIDLSIGSVVALGAVVFGLLLGRGVPPVLAALVVVAGSALIGLFHGVLVTRLQLQPFLVTLCGLFIYRGIARCLSANSSVGLKSGASPEFDASIDAFRGFFMGSVFGVPAMLILFALLCVVLGLFLHGTRHGRYLLAIGANEEAARYAGIDTSSYKILAYVLCSALVGVVGVLEITESYTAQGTQTGQLYELYAITGAVLGGCSLSGGEGSVPGMFLGAAVLPMLRQLPNRLLKPLTEWMSDRGLGDYSGIINELDWVVIGLALLAGTIADRMLKKQRK